MKPSLCPPPEGMDDPGPTRLREILNAVFFLSKSGCQWRLLPNDFPRSPTVYHYFKKMALRRHLGEDQSGYP